MATKSGYEVADSEATTTVEWHPVMRELTAGDIMNPGVIVVYPDTPLSQLVEKLVENRISAVPVLDEDGNVVGMVSETDLIDEEKRKVRLPGTLLFGKAPILEDAVREAYDEGAGQVASHVMSRHPVTVSDDTPARSVAELMVSRKINHVPVVRNGQILGIIARSDILRAVQSEWVKKAGA